MTNNLNKAQINIKKATSVLNKINTMIDQKEYCINIMQQNLAVLGLLKSAHHLLMENHLRTCFTNATNAKNQKLKENMINEIIKVSKLNK